MSIRKIDGSALVTYRIVKAGFFIQNKLKKIWFFKKTFLLANISIKIVLKKLFVTFSNVNIWFVEKKLIWRSYTTIEVFLTTKKVGLIDKK